MTTESKPVYLHKFIYKTGAGPAIFLMLVMMNFIGEIMIDIL